MKLFDLIFGRLIWPGVPVALLIAPVIWIIAYFTSSSPVFWVLGSTVFSIVVFIIAVVRANKK